MYRLSMDIYGYDYDKCIDYLWISMDYLSIKISTSWDIYGYDYD